MQRQLSQQEIDALFGDGRTKDSSGPKATPFDFDRLDRIPKSQLQAIRLLNENFVRSLASSLSAYLRSYLAVQLASVEQLSYDEFLAGLSSPSCLVCLGLKPYDGNAVLELAPCLAFQILEMVLGGKGRRSTALSRELTEIEKGLLDGVLRIVLHDLKEAWESVAAMDFTVEALETDPQMLRVFDAGDAFVSTGIEMRIGEASGMMTLAFPALVIKMMRNKFDQQGLRRKAGTVEADQSRMLRLLGPASLDLDVRLEGNRLMVGDLLRLREGDVLPFDGSARRTVDCLVNGVAKLQGHIVSAGNRKALLVEAPRKADP